MKKLILIFLILLSISSCRSKMDQCIENAMDDGFSRSQAQEMCEEGRDNSIRR